MTGIRGYAPFLLALLPLGMSTACTGDDPLDDFSVTGAPVNGTGTTVMGTGTTAAPTDNSAGATSATTGSGASTMGAQGGSSMGGVVVDGGTSGGVIEGDASTSDAGVDGSLPEPVHPGLAGTGLTPIETSGEPLVADPMTWTYIELPDTQCRDGSASGLALSLNPASTKVMIFFEGGGACFDTVSCAANPANTATMQGEKTEGVFDRNNDENPFKDWNFVYLPYCTGDVFAGTRADVQVAGATQQFVGYLNVRKFLERLVPTFPDATEIVVTGISAGGFGSSANVVQIQRAFPDVVGKLINDSGPPMPSDALAPCLQQRWRETWGFDESMLADCGDACPDPNDYTADYGRYLASTFDNRLSGLIESAQDSIIAGFFGAGTDPIGLGPCTGTVLLNSVPAADFRNGLLDFRESVREYDNFGTWYPDDTQHTWLSGESFYTATIGSQRLVDWVSDIVLDVGTSHVGP